LLLINPLLHLQAIFSIGLIPFSWITKYKNLVLPLVVILLGAIYLQKFPSIANLSILTKTSALVYVQEGLAGAFENESLFPLGNLLIVIYFFTIYLFKDKLLDDTLLLRYVIATILLSLFLAWFFAAIHTMQSRLFDFYITPIIFLAGNLRRNMWAYVLTLVVSILLFIRLTIVNQYVLG
jgi:hypothetical protein